MMLFHQGYSRLLLPIFLIRHNVRELQRPAKVMEQTLAIGTSTILITSSAMALRQLATSFKSLQIVTIRLPSRCFGYIQAELENALPTPMIIAQQTPPSSTSNTPRAGAMGGG